MSGLAEQVRCPSCGGGQAVQESDRYECRFCLTAFTFRHAQDEEARVLEEIKAWVEQRVGSQAGGGGEGIDASSRAYLFRKNLLPALETTFDRALETTLGFEQHALLPAPAENGSTQQGNPLLDRRDEVLQLRDLRARLESPEVQTFAVTDDDRARIAELDDRLQEIVALSNTAHAAAQGTAQGFAAARHNLESVLASGSVHAGVANRYRVLADLARLMELASDSTSLAGHPLATEADEIADRLEEIAHRLETDDAGSVGASLASVAARNEAGHARDLARWLRSYDTIVRRADVPFSIFVRDTLEIVSGGGSGEEAARIVAGCARAVRAIRGEEPVHAIESFDWTGSAADGHRKGKFLGMIGLGVLGMTEEVARSEEFFVPFWLLKAGGTTWLADACGVAEPSVFSLQGEWADLAQPLDKPVPVRRPRPVPVPSVTAPDARKRIRAELRAAGIHNAGLSEPALALLPAVSIHLRTGKGAERVETSCLAGRITLGGAILHHLAVARRLQERFQ